MIGSAVGIGKTHDGYRQQQTNVILFRTYIHFSDTFFLWSQSMCLSFAFGLSYTLSLQSALAPIYIRGQFNPIAIIIVTGISLVSRYHRHKCVLVSYEKKLFHLQ